MPERYDWDGSSDIDLDTYFAMARGRQTGGVDVTAMEMTKWFDTNYHYIVPELERGMEFRFSSRKPFEQYEEAKALGIETKPVLIGPLTFLLQGKCADEEFDRLELLDGLVEVYAEVLAELGQLGAEWVQIDEPVLVEDRTPGRAGGARARVHAAGRRRGRAQDPRRHLLRPRRRGLPGAHRPAGRRRRRSTSCAGRRTSS